MTPFQSNLSLFETSQALGPLLPDEVQQRLFALLTARHEGVHASRLLIGSRPKEPRSFFAPQWCQETFEIEAIFILHHFTMVFFTAVVHPTKLDIKWQETPKIPDACLPLKGSVTDASAKSTTNCHKKCKMLAQSYRRLFKHAAA